MSQYITFFLGESKEKLLCKLCSFSRSSVIYQKFRGAPYGQVESLSPVYVDVFAHRCNDEKFELKEQLARIGRKIEQVVEFNNSAQEKIQLISDLDEDERKIVQQLEEVEFSLNFAYFLSDLIENVAQDGKFSVFYGIEVPFSEKLV